MKKAIRNAWDRVGDAPFETAQILQHDVHPEGLDVGRLRALEAAPTHLAGPEVVSVLRGGGALRVAGHDAPLRVEAGVHVYLPANREAVLEMSAGTELVRVRGASASQGRGTELLVRDETFIAACGTDNQALRWILTPQYLSRRIFLHHDRALVSRSGNPVSWFHTTMFNVAGLPPNQDGEPVFKMAYGSRTEFNVCFEVEGVARVRMATHPYTSPKQTWGPWLPLDGDTTYHLNEAATGSDAEWFVDAGGVRRPLRNRHEVYIEGHVSLYCLFDPAPIGIEQHRPGEYSDYDAIDAIQGTPAYESYVAALTSADRMVDRLSLAKAEGVLDSMRDTAEWDFYLHGQEAQRRREKTLHEALRAQGRDRESILRRWMQPG